MPFFNYEYIGLKKASSLFLALLYARCTNTRVFVDGKIVKLKVKAWSIFSGEGFENFKKLQQEQ